MIEFPDREGDSRVGKVSWVVLLGPNRAARVAQACVVTAFVLAALGARLEASP